MSDLWVYEVIVSRLIEWRQIDVLLIEVRAGIGILVIGFESFLYVRLRKVSFRDGLFILLASFFSIRISLNRRIFGHVGFRIYLWELRIKIFFDGVFWWVVSFSLKVENFV